MATAPPIAASPEPVLERRMTAGRLDIVAGGAWTTAHADALERLVDGVGPQVAGASQVFVDIAKVDALDTLGAWLLERLVRRPDLAGKHVELTGVSPRYHGLIEEMHAVNHERRPPAKPPNPVLGALESTGRAAAGSVSDLAMFLGMFGELAVALGRVLVDPRRFRLTSTVYQLYRVGWLAVPIMVLITFLIGGIIAQQGIFHFRKFGAESYVVDMVGILVLREIGVLLVSIMIAGRSGSSYTAEIGAMKMREEIDALRTMGFDPVEVLILPRIIALVCALPILTFLGSMAALYGGGLVAWLYGGMSPAVFIARLHEAISVTHFEVGMIKAPFMALAIGVVACSEGLAVKGSAESLGTQTTISVVKSIFLVIVLDGVFAVFFASIGM
ncbi:MAG: MlaE family lipid ABC transporter permease subunit [Xanthobacteraceae bacterium]|nr:MlaE family lipid ABC transporter permease subunit [Xanthobacteraceae bacterium]